MNKNTEMLLETSFDIDQVGQTLVWKFVGTDEDGTPTEGRNAGSIYFQPGEKMFVRVKGGSKTPFNSFQVLDACLITMPQVTQIGGGNPTLYALPSPFAPTALGQTVCSTLNLAANKFEARQVENHDPHYHEITQVWSDHLVVAEPRGRWELSFVLTVRIFRKDGDPKGELRTFCFDPECEVGPGF